MLVGTPKCRTGFGLFYGRMDSASMFMRYLDSSFVWESSDGDNEGRAVYRFPGNNHSPSPRGGLTARSGRLSSIDLFVIRALQLATVSCETSTF